MTKYSKKFISSSALTFMGVLVLVLGLTGCPSSDDSSDALPDITATGGSPQVGDATIKVTLSGATFKTSGVGIGDFTITPALGGTATVTTTSTTATIKGFTAFTSTTAPSVVVKASALATAVAGTSAVATLAFSGPVAPDITTVTYNSGTGALAITGTGFPTTGSVAVDKFKLSTYTLTTTATTGSSGTHASATTIIITLGTTDKTAVNALAGFTANGTTTAAQGLTTVAGWVTGGTAITTGVAVVVSGYAAATPSITSVAYNRTTGVLTINGTGFPTSGGPPTSSKFTLGTKTLTGVSAGPNHASTTTFTITITDPDKTAVNALPGFTGAGTTIDVQGLTTSADWVPGGTAITVGIAVVVTV